MQLAYRARADGFWTAIDTESTTDQVELWHVAFDGQSTRLGAYPAPPSSSRRTLHEAELDAKGRLHQMALALDGATIRHTIIRRSLDGESVVIGDEADNPVVQLQNASLFTGP